jgi:hypothetical protein
MNLKIYDIFIKGYWLYLIEIRIVVESVLASNIWREA